MTKTGRFHAVGDELKTRLSLRMFGEHGEPERVGAAIGGAAIKGYRKGDRVGRQSTALRSKGMCIYEFGGDDMGAQVRESLAMEGPVPPCPPADS